MGKNVSCLLGNMRLPENRCLICLMDQDVEGTVWGTVRTNRHRMHRQG